MSDADTMKKPGKHDWSRFDALTDVEVHAAALADPDAQPLTRLMRFIAAVSPPFGIEAAVYRLCR